MDPTKWPIAIDEPDPILSPTPTSSIANSEHSGRDATNNDPIMLEGSDIYRDLESACALSSIPNVCDHADSFHSDTNYIDSPCSFIHSNQIEDRAEDYIPTPSYAIQSDDVNGLVACDLAQVDSAMNQNESDNLVSTSLPITTLSSASPVGNLNPNVPEFVPTFAAVGCSNTANSVNLNREDKNQDDSDEEGKIMAWVGLWYRKRGAPF